MTGFTSTLPAPTPAAPADDVIGNDGWFPNLAMSDIRHTTRMDGTVTDPRLRAAVLYAISDTNRQLAAFRAAQQQAGHASLSAVPAPVLGDGSSQLVLLYQRAIRCAVSADLMERYRNFDATGAGDARAEQADEAIAEQRRNAHWAIRDIQGLPHTTVELI